MRPALGVALALLVVFAGCTSPTGGGTTTAPTAGTTADPGSTGGTTTVDGSTTTTTTDGSADPTTDVSTTTATGGGGMVEDPPDPATDRLGWEAGIWHNETIAVTNDDGMNATERRLAVARAMARIELVRQTEFPGNRTVPVDVRSREAFKDNQTGGSNYSEAFRTFDNVKFEAMLFVDSRNNSIDVQNENRGASVAGYYSPKADSMVLITESELPQFDGEKTLAHELVHALQDRKYNLSTVRGDGTRDGYAGYTGLVEGDAKYVELNYMDRCETGWACIASPGGSGPGANASGIHFGIYFLQFFPYSDGPTFIAHHLARGGWDRIDAMYDDVPASAEQIIFPNRYGVDAPVEVSLSDDTSGDWERVRPEPQQPGSQRPEYARLGQAALSSMFIYTAYDQSNSSRLVSPFSILNLGDGPGGVNSTDPINYGLEITNGWAGDRLHAYRNADSGETGYVWRIEWETPADAAEFRDAYAALLSYWGGSRTGTQLYTIPDGRQFDGAYHVAVDGETLTIAHAPSVAQLGDVYGPAGS